MTHSHRRPPPIPPCDLYSEQVHLLVDRELGPAEEALVEAHLQGCPRCQVLVSRLERMASLLKEWDAEAGDVEAPIHRLRHAVLTRVADQGAFRRREGRHTTFVQFATAAVVLLGLGLGVLLGLRARPAESPAPDAAAVSHVIERRVAVPRTHAFPGIDIPRSAVAVDLDLPALSPIPASDSPEPANFDFGEDAVPEVAFLLAHRGDLVAFSERVGAPSVRLAIPQEKGHVFRFVTAEAAHWLLKPDRQGKCKLAKWEEAVLSAQISQSVAPTAPASPDRIDTGVSAVAMLRPLPGVTSEVRALTGSRPYLSAITAPRAKNAMSVPRPSLVRAFGIREARSSGLRSRPLGHGRPTSFLDPIKAFNAGNLRLEAGRDGLSVIALVKGTEQPIFIPAGQFVTGWGPDRVVAQPTWLPAERAERTYVIPCRLVAQAADGRSGGVPRLDSAVAGPTIRALLAADASQPRIRAVAKRQFASRLPDPAVVDSWGDWSLLALYGGPRSRENLERLRRGVRFRGEAGFVALDAQGRLLGLEVLRVKGRAAEELLLRLWHSYATEALYRDIAKSDEGYAPPAEGLARALALLAAHEGTFQQPRTFGQAEGAKVSMLEVPVAGLHLHALEVGDAPVAVSGLSSVPAK